MIYYVYYIILGLQLMTLLVQKLDEISLAVCSKTKKKLHEKKTKKMFELFLFHNIKGESRQNSNSLLIAFEFTGTSQRSKPLCVFITY